MVLIDSQVLEKVKNLDLNNLSYLELGRIFGKDEKTVRLLFKRLGIIKLKKIHNRKIPEYSKIIQLTKEGYNSKQVAELTGKSIRQITVFKDSLKIHQSKFPKTSVDRTFYEIIIGSLLGDGCISRMNRKYDYYSFVEGHCLRQKEYLLWKKSILEKYLPVKYIEKWVVDTRFKEGGGVSCRLRAKEDPLFKELREIFYPEGKKILPDMTFEYLTPLALAIWFQDDGCSSGVICSMSFTQEENYKLSQFLLNTYSVKTIVRKNNTIYIREESRNLFNTIIREFIQPCMMYKLSPHKIPLNGESPVKGNPVLNQSETIVNA